MTAEQRLDTVENDLDVVKKLLVSAARYAESANQERQPAIARFSDLKTSSVQKVVNLCQPSTVNFT